MLKDPNFNVADLTFRNLDKGIAFSEYYMTSPIDGRNIPTVVGVIDPNHPKWKDKSECKKPVRMMLCAKHSTGIYQGFPLDDAINLFSSTEMVCDFPDFDLSTGMWYSMDEMREQFATSDEPLTSGKPRMNMGRMGTSYGLSDDITQILKHYKAVLMRTDYDVVLHLIHHNKNDLNGMRWHKQGKYLGKFKKRHEYMSDEDGLNSILQYHFYVIK